MCDYSLHHVKSRPANIGEKLITRNFNTGTRGFASPDDRTTAVCILPGTAVPVDGRFRTTRWPLSHLCGDARDRNGRVPQELAARTIPVVASRQLSVTANKIAVEEAH